MLLLSINYIAVVNQSSAKIRNACQYQQGIECEKEFDYSILHN